jgi:CRP-like cAMP-binding protein
MDEDGLAPGSLLTFLQADERRLLVDAGAARAFPPDEVMLRQGDPTTHVLVVLTGWVRISSVTSEGQDLLMAFRGPGDVIGELAAVLDWDRTATVRTLERVTAVQLRRDHYLDLLRTRPELALAVIRQLSVRLHEAGTSRADFATLDVTKRVAAYLVRLIGPHGVHTAAGVALRIPLGQQDVANRVDASLRSVARAFAILRDRGIVTSARNQVVIARPEVLRAFVGHLPNGM